MSDVASFKIPDTLAQLSAKSRVIYSPNVKRLPNLESLSAGLSANSQLHFIFDKKSAANETSRISYSDLSTCNIEAIRVAPLVKIEHEWTLSNKTNDTFLLNTQAIFNADKQYKDGAPGDVLSAGYAAINYEYYRTGVLGKIIDLSNLIYKRPRVPSFVGQIIYTNKLATEEAVKSIYGGQSWQQINFRFMCGQTATGNKEENTITKFGDLSAGEFSTREYPALNNQNISGGNEYVKLSAQHISPHTHKIKAEKESFTLSWEVSPTTDSFWTAEKERTKRSYLAGNNTGCYTARLEDPGKIKAKFSGECIISTEILWGSTVAMTSDIYDSSGNGRKIANPKHNNMPPFETAYVWKRVL